MNLQFIKPECFVLESLEKSIADLYDIACYKAEDSIPLLSDFQEDASWICAFCILSESYFKDGVMQGEKSIRSDLIDFLKVREFDSVEQGFLEYADELMDGGVVFYRQAYEASAFDVAYALDIQRLLEHYQLPYRIE